MGASPNHTRHTLRTQEQGDDANIARVEGELQKLSQTVEITKQARRLYGC